MLFAFTDIDGWHAGIGDPTLIGWITVAAYFLAAFLTFRAAKSSDVIRERRQKFFWLVLSVILVLLGINKQLDLQTLLTLTMRKLAIYEGIYEKRRVLQAFFIVIVALCGAAGFMIMSRLAKSRAPEVKLGLAGLFFLIVFIVIRAASFHHIDAFLKHDIGGFRMNWVLELGGISLIGIAAFKKMRRGSGRSSRIPPANPQYCPG